MHDYQKVKILKSMRFVNVFFYFSGHNIEAVTSQNCAFLRSLEHYTIRYVII